MAFESRRIRGCYHQLHFAESRHQSRRGSSDLAGHRVNGHLRGQQTRFVRSVCPGSAQPHPPSLRVPSREFPRARRSRYPAGLQRNGRRARALDRRTVGFRGYHGGLVGATPQGLLAVTGTGELHHLTDGEAVFHRGVEQKSHVAMR